MAERRRGLGRGLGALIPSAPTAETDAPPVDSVQPAPGAEAEHQTRLESSGGTRADSAAESTPLSPADAPDRAKSSGGKTTAKTADSGRKTKKGSGAKNGASRSPSHAGPVSSPETQEAPALDLEGLSDRRAPDGGHQGSETADATTSGDADDVSRETPTPRRRTASPVSRQKAMRSRMDMGAALRSRAGADRPSDMFFSPSSWSTESAESADEAAEDAEATQSEPEGGVTAGVGPAVSRETAAEETPSQSSEPQPPSPLSTGSAAEASHADPVAADPADADHSETDPIAADPAGAVSAEEDPTEATTDLAAVPGAVFAEVSIDDIHANRKQPRQAFDEDELAELAYSIGELGVLQPIVVRPSREPEGPRHELVMGERRWRATQRAGLPTIPAIIRETADDDLLRDALLENLHRSQLNPLEEAAAYQQLLEEFGATQEELSRRIGRSRPQISNTLRLMKLPPLVQRRVAAGVLSAGHARALLALEDPAEMERLAQRIVAEGMSVRAAEEAASLSKRSTSTRRAGAQAQERHRERLDYIADAFADKLDTSVKINLGARKGRMTIEFASVEDLNRIITVLDPQADAGSDAEATGS